MSENLIKDIEKDWLMETDEIPGITPEEEIELLKITDEVTGGSPVTLQEPAQLSNSIIPKQVDIMSLPKIPKKTLFKPENALDDIIINAPPKYQSPLLLVEGMATATGLNSYSMKIPENATPKIPQIPKSNPEKSIPNEHVVVNEVPVVVPKYAPIGNPVVVKRKVRGPRDSLSKRIHSQVRAAMKRQKPRVPQFIRPPVPNIFPPYMPPPVNPYFPNVPPQPMYHPQMVPYFHFMVPPRGAFRGHRH